MKGCLLVSPEFAAGGFFALLSFQLSTAEVDYVAAEAGRLRPGVNPPPPRSLCAGARE